MSYPCKEALKKLERARQTAKECIKFMICPSCGGDLKHMSISGATVVECTTCKERFDPRIGM